MPLLTVKDVAARLHVNEKTVYSWVSQGKIPCMKLNGVIRFDQTDIQQWLQRCYVSVGPPHMPATNRRKGSATSVDTLIERATRAVYTACGETRPIASPKGKEGTDGAR